MKCIVTGGAGFIGSHICEYLVNKGNHVISIDNYKTGKKENHVHLDSSPNFEAVNMSILDSRLRDYMRGVDVIFHQAASKKTVCLQDPCIDLDTNGKGTLKLLQLAKEFNIIKFIHASTGSVYGSVPGLITEEVNKKPCSYYGISKLAGENYVNYFAQTYDLNATILRYFHIYGSRQDASNEGGVVAIFTDRMKRNKNITIYGDGSQIRCFTHVKDVVEANIKALGVRKGIYNVCSGNRTDIASLIDKIEDKLGIVGYSNINYADWVEGDIKDFHVSNEKIKRDMGIKFQKELKFDWI